jgi:hypothetical protein
MNQYGHMKIVRCALDFIINDGTQEQLLALSSLRKNFGDARIGGLIIEVPNVDKYFEFAFRSWWGCDNIVEAQGNQICSLNHFVNGFIDTPPSWSSGIGYYYPWSMFGDNDERFASAVKDYHIYTDPGHSTLLPRIKTWWRTDKPELWDHAFGAQTLVTNIEFAPASVLAGSYYRLLLAGGPSTQVSHAGIEVEGICDMPTTGHNEAINSVTHIAPVLHMIADACVPHHARCTLGCGHSEWEKNVEMNCGKELWGLMDISMVKELLGKLTLADRYEIQPGAPLGDQFAGRFSPEDLVLAISRETVQQLCRTSGKARNDLWAAGRDWWFAYGYSDDELARFDRKYLFNLAIAGTIIALVRAHHDLVYLNRIKDTTSVVTAPLPPTKELVALESTPPEKRRKLPFMEGADWGRVGGVPKLLRQTNKVFAISSIEQLDIDAVMQVTKQIDSYLVAQFEIAQRRLGPRFNPFQLSFQKMFPDMHPIFGVFTTRLPSEKEVSDSASRKQYLSEIAIYEFKADILMQVFGISALKALAQVRGPTYRERARLLDTIKKNESRLMTFLRTRGRAPTESSVHIPH